LVITILAFAIALGLTVKRIGVGSYLGLLAFSLIATLVFFATYRPSS